MNDSTNVSCLILPGGTPLYHEGEDENTGWDAGARAIVSTDFDERHRHMRKEIYGFDKPSNGQGGHVRFENGRYEYLLMPGETVNIGLGLVIAVEQGYTAVLSRRGGTGVKDLDLLSEPDIPEYITDRMGNVFIDPGFRGEPIARLHNGGKVSFPIWKGRRLVQFGFWKVMVSPKIGYVSALDELGHTHRGARCHNSSGTG